MKKTGFTLVEVLIVVCILGIMVALIFSQLSGCNQATDKTHKSAAEFAKNLGETVTNITCVDRDTDGDGYVTCTVFRKNKDPLSIECARGWTLNEGCKLPKVSFQNLGR